MAERDLQGQSRQVLYCFEQVEWTAKRLVDITIGSPQSGWKERFGTTLEDVDHPPRSLVNALVESLLVNARQLAAFFYGSPRSERQAAAASKRGKPRRGDDSFALDYFDSPAEWRNPGARGRRPKMLSDTEFSNRVGREVTHLTYHRANFKEGGPPWSPYAVYSELAAVMERFAERVDPSRVCDDFHERVTAALPMKQPAPYEPHRPGTYFVGPPLLESDAKAPRPRATSGLAGNRSQVEARV
jgi:hypothetical protein